MSLFVETGAVVAGAESYISVADATAYHVARGNSPWSLLTEPQAEEALRRATDYMTQMYRSRWVGFRKAAGQALDWPRSSVYLEPFAIGGVGSQPFLFADDSVPEEVRRACAELALRAAAGPLAPDIARQAIQETVGPISVTYDRASESYAVYRSVDASLRPYLSGGSSMNARIGRA